MTALWGSAVVLGGFAFAGFANLHRPELYDRLSQEDGWVEWSTVWAFLLACVLWVRVSRQSEGTAWRKVFPLAVAALCFFVAMEEVSWGQRLLGARAPAFFLEHNTQLEANLHNLASRDLRNLALHAVILLFGVALPVASRVPPLGPLQARLGVSAPGTALLPAFIGCFLLYLSYPWRLTGEWVELGLGLALLFFGLARSADEAGGRRLPATAIAATLGIGLAGWASAAATRSVQSVPAALEQAQRELAALKQDHRSGILRAGCGTHTRVYRFVSKREGAGAPAAQGAFAALVQEGVPAERARFYLDPWNTPYWMLDECADDGSRRIAFYSLGPNRARESDHWNLRGDDVGAIVFEWRAPQEDD
jgi:hypothetical protein